MGLSGQRHALAALPLGKRPGSHCIGGWVEHTTGVEKSHPHSDSISGPSTRSVSLYRLRYPGPLQKNMGAV
jgi:hypothetical protein